MKRKMNKKQLKGRVKELEKLNEGMRSDLEYWKASYFKKVDEIIIILEKQNKATRTKSLNLTSINSC